MGIAHAGDRYTDKRLSRSMELYRLETGLESPEVRETLAAKEKEAAVNREAMRVAEAEAAMASSQRDAAVEAMQQEREQHQSIMRQTQDEMAKTLNEMSEILTKQRKEERDPKLAKEALRAQLMDERRGGLSSVEPYVAEDTSMLHEYELMEGTLEDNFKRILSELDFKLVWNAPRYQVEQPFIVKATDIFSAIEQVMQAYAERGAALEANVYSKNLTVEVTLSQWKHQKMAPVAQGAAQ